MVAAVSLTPLFDTTIIIKCMKELVKVLKISIKHSTQYLTKSTEWE